MQKETIVDLNITFSTKPELLTQINSRLNKAEKTWIITAYSEFIYKSLKDKQLNTLLNSADLIIPDGISVFWTKYFFEFSLYFKNAYLKFLEIAWQIFYSLIFFFLEQKKYYEKIHAEKISGSDLIFDLCALATKHDYSVFLLGGFGSTTELAANNLKRSFPSLNIVGFSNANSDNSEIVNIINQKKPDILFVAYGPIKQEKWIFKHKDQLSSKLFIGVGGTFDYLAGKQPQPPKKIRQVGLEWLWRLVTQPKRFKRIFNSTFGLFYFLALKKMLTGLKYRKNIAICVTNINNEVLVCRRNPNIDLWKKLGYDPKKFVNYWQLPQGGVDEPETFEQAALRELQEETGISNASVKLIKISDNYCQYDFPLSWKITSGKTRGQKQKVAFFEFSGKDSEILVDNYEFIDFKWVNIKDLSQTIHPERKNQTDLVLENLKQVV